MFIQYSYPYLKDFKLICLHRFGSGFRYKMPNCFKYLYF
jgi:hypothetical protein